MRIRYIPADPAGNLTAFVLDDVPASQRAAIAARLMALCPKEMEQVGFVDEGSLTGPLPRMAMMGGEFCGNAARAFALYVAKKRGKGERMLCVGISGAEKPVPVTLAPERGEAFARMPLPRAVEKFAVWGKKTPVVRMEGIAHAVLFNTAPSEEAARTVLRAMPKEDAQGVLFVQGEHMTPFVYVAATETGVWESSCGSGSVALGVLLAQKEADGEHAYTFAEPGGVLSVRVTVSGGTCTQAVMGGQVALGEEKSIDIGPFGGA